MSKRSFVTAAQQMEQASMTDNFNHLVEINEDNKQLTIYRIYDNGEKELFTYVDIPSISFKNDKGKFESFAQQLGENLLFDSQAARHMLGL